MQQPPPQSPLPIPPSSSSKFKPHKTSVSITSNNITDSKLLSLLRQRRTDEAYEHYTNLQTLPGPTCLSRLLAQLSHQNTTSSLSRAHSLLRRLRESKQLHLLDSDSLGLLVLSSAKSNHLPFSLSLLRLMLRSHYLPKLPAWSAVVSRLSNAHPDDSPGPADALRLFLSVLNYLRAIPLSISSASLPDTAAFNAALNACANLGDDASFVSIFNGMEEFGIVPDVLTYNVLIKMVARAERKELLVRVLETVLDRGLVPCPTTLHSLVAAYVGLRDLASAERMVQAMREGRLDICAVLPESDTPTSQLNPTLFCYVDLRFYYINDVN